MPDLPKMDMTDGADGRFGGIKCDWFVEIAVISDSVVEMFSAELVRDSKLMSIVIGRIR